MNEQITTGLSSDTHPPTPRDPFDAPPTAQPAPETQPAAGRTRRTRPPRGARRQTGHDGAHTSVQAADQDEEMTSTRKRRRVNRKTDSGLLPALRLNRYVGRERAERKPAMVYDTVRPPRRLRLTRLALGLSLLAVAWAAALLVIQLTLALLMDFPNQPSLTERFALSLLSAVGILWLAVVALALIVVGAFSLMLALTRRGW